MEAMRLFTPLDFPQHRQEILRSIQALQASAEPEARPASTEKSSSWLSRRRTTYAAPAEKQRRRPAGKLSKRKDSEQQATIPQGLILEQQRELELLKCRSSDDTPAPLISIPYEETKRHGQAQRPALRRRPESDLPRYRSADEPANSIISSDGVERQTQSESLHPQRQHGTTPRKCPLPVKPALSVTIPEDEIGRSSHGGPVYLEESTLDKATEYSPIASSPFAPSAYFEDVSDDRIVASSKRVAQRFEVAPRQRVVNDGTTLSQHTRQLPPVHPALRKVHTAVIEPSTICDPHAHDFSPPVYSRPMPSSPPPSLLATRSSPLAAVPIASRTRSARRTSPDTALHEESPVSPLSDTSNFNSPFGRFGPIALTPTDSEPDTSDLVSPCSSFSLPTPSSIVRTSFCEPPAIPQRSQRRCARKDDAQIANPSGKWHAAPVWAKTRSASHTVINTISRHHQEEIEASGGSEAKPLVHDTAIGGNVNNTQDLDGDIVGLLTSMLRQTTPASKIGGEVSDSDLLAQLASIASGIQGLQASLVCRAGSGRLERS